MARVTAAFLPSEPGNLATAAVGIMLSAGLARIARRAGATDRARALGRRGNRVLRVVRERLAAALVAAYAPPDAGASVQVCLLAAVPSGPVLEPERS